MTHSILAERLNVQPLTEEEKQQRHILGRLFGPIATCLESTRNGRKYNRQLWEKALNDELFHEKLANKCLFLELGHPADREETDMKQVCACIPEMPKIIDGDLCASVDILDTPNGRLLKTLVDYGFVPGISSRGSGDILDTNEVDPETFFLECFDIVSIPAVKKARLNVCESLDSDGIKLKKALAESYKAAKEEDKDTMKKALENLNIDINNELTEPEKIEESAKKVLTADDIPWDPEVEQENILTEEMPAEDSEDKLDDVTEVEESSDTEDKETEDSEELTNNDEPAEDDNIDTEPAEGEEIDVTSRGEAELDTVGDAIEMLQEYDDDTKIEIEPVQVEGKEYQIDGITSFVDDENEDEDILVIGVTCENSEDTLENADSNIEAIEPEDEEDSVETIEEVEDDSDTADDDGDVEVIESLKEMVRQKEALETEVSNLRKAKTVGDAKEQELQEKLDRYRTAFKNTSAEAAKVPELQSKVKKLSEQITQAKTTIKTLTEQVNNARQLKESIDNSKTTVNRLNEEVLKLTKKSETLEAKLEGQTKVYTEKLQERTNLAKTYKARFIETLTRYVGSKASMLGVQPSEITSRLNENYSLADVDAVCDQILDSTVTFSRLPFGGRTKASARIAESVSKSAIAATKSNSEYGYDIDDSLLELAGLK